MSGLTSIPRLESVRERDIDLLLMEEISCCQNFRLWFLNQILPSTDFNFIGVWHSVYESSLGESDLVILLEKENIKYAILIENKIDALVQSEQASRYRERGQSGIAQARWDRFQTVIVAPQHYLTTALEADDFDVMIQYEAIEKFLRSEGTERSIYRAKLLSSAIEQERRGYQPVKDEEVTAFWISYFHRLSATENGLSMKRPIIVPSGSDWIPLYHEQLPVGSTLLHKLSEGCIDLQFPVAAFGIDVFEHIPAELLSESSIRLVRMKRSNALRATTLPMLRKLPFNDQEEAFTAAMASIHRLLQFLTACPIYPLRIH